LFIYEFSLTSNHQSFTANDRAGQLECFGIATLHPVVRARAVQNGGDEIVAGEENLKGFFVDSSMPIELE
jgi:hypothetical protein